MNRELTQLPPRYEIPGHPFHLVELSPWPIVISFALLFVTVNAVGYFHHVDYAGYGLILSFISVFTTAYLWFRDVGNEATLGGYHTAAVQRGITIGFILFVISEVFFFLSIFWAYLHSGLSPAVQIGSMWPPMGIEAINAFEIPLLNTVLLLSSAGALTYGHHALIQGNRKGAIVGMITTLVLAVTFTGFQFMEYLEAPFTITDSVYGSVFYFGTGFHGIHVMCGTIFLTVAFARIVNYSMTNMHHQNLETSAIYYHFVDYVWLLLWLVFYFWGS